MERPSLKKYAWLSIGAAVATIVLKTAAFLLTGSVGLLSDAAESLVNLAGAIVALRMLSVAARPPDESHPHGHSKAEYFSSGTEGVYAQLGFEGLDEITLGGIPRGRATLVCGAAGCGKTLFGMEFLVRGAKDFDEPGVCLSFEETDDELTSNLASLGFVSALIARKKLAIDHIYLERSLIEETGDYDLEALFVRLGHAVDSIGAKRVLLDSVEALFAGLQNEAVLRSELRRLFRWLKERKLTAIVTGERGQGTLTRHGLEEYIWI